MSGSDRPAAGESPPRRDRSGPRELLPRPVRLLIGATGPGISDHRLREAVAGRVALITGASSGVGEASAHRLAAAGAARRAPSGAA